MKKILLIMLGAWLLFSLSGCSLSLLGSPKPLVLPTPTVLLPFETPAPPTTTATLALPTVTPGTPPAATSTSPNIVPTAVVPTTGTPSGPYVVVLVSSTDVLNI